MKTGRFSELLKNKPENLECRTLYKQWLNSAQPMDQYIYFTGAYTSESIVSSTIAKIVRDDAYEGKVYLFQRKIAPFVYNHIAVKASLTRHQRLIPIKFSEASYG